MTRSTSKHAHTSVAAPDFGTPLDERPKEAQSQTVQERAAPVQLKFAKARKPTKKGRKRLRIDTIESSNQQYTQLERNIQSLLEQKRSPNTQESLKLPVDNKRSSSVIKYNETLQPSPLIAQLELSEKISLPESAASSARINLTSRIEVVDDASQEQGNPPPSTMPAKMRVTSKSSNYWVHASEKGEEEAPTEVLKGETTIKAGSRILIPVRQDKYESRLSARKRSQLTSLVRRGDLSGTGLGRNEGIDSRRSS